MLVGSYPFEDPEDPRNFRANIMVSYLLIITIKKNVPYDQSINILDL